MSYGGMEMRSLTSVMLTPMLSVKSRALLICMKERCLTLCQ